jgi:hypothetical protein
MERLGNSINYILGGLVSLSVLEYTTPVYGVLGVLRMLLIVRSLVEANCSFLRKYNLKLYGVLYINTQSRLLRRK